MELKIGFIDTPRELVLSVSEDQDALSAKVREALEGNGGDVLELRDARGHRFIMRTRQIAYVEVVGSTSRTVGFAGA